MIFTVLFDNTHTHSLNKVNILFCELTFPEIPDKYRSRDVIYTVVLSKARYFTAF